jgi:hypothetical protein
LELLFSVYLCYVERKGKGQRKKDKKDKRKRKEKKRNLKSVLDSKYENECYLGYTNKIK